MADLDHKQFAVVNGDGGTYAPVYPITIAGAGMQATLARVDYGGTLTIANGASTQVGDWLHLAAGNEHRTVTDTIPISDGVVFPMPEAEVVNVANPCGIMPLASSILGEQVRIVVPFRPRVGRILQATLTFRVMHEAKVPKSLPRARVLRVDADGIPQAISDWATYDKVSTDEEWVGGHQAKYLSVACRDIPRASTRLVAEAASDTLRVVSSERFSVNDFVSVNSELMQVLSINGTTLKVARTGTETHASGATVATVASEPLTTVNEASYTYAIEIEPEGGVDENAAIVDRVELPDVAALAANIDDAETILAVSSAELLFGESFSSYPQPIARMIRIGEEWMFAFRAESATVVHVVRGISSTAVAHLLGDEIYCFDTFGPRASNSAGTEVVLWLKSYDHRLNGVYKRGTFGAHKVDIVSHVLDAKTGSWYSRAETNVVDFPEHVSLLRTGMDVSDKDVQIIDKHFRYSNRDVIRIDNELMQVTGVRSMWDFQALLVKRGYEDTAPEAHLADAPVFVLRDEPKNTEPGYSWSEVTNGVPFGPLAWWVSAQVEYEVESLR